MEKSLPDDVLCLASMTSSVSGSTRYGVQMPDMPPTPPSLGLSTTAYGLNAMPDIVMTPSLCDAAPMAHFMDFPAASQVEHHSARHAPSACYYIANEGMSVLENAALMDIPFPAKLEGTLETLKQKSDSSDEDPPDAIN